MGWTSTRAGAIAAAFLCGVALVPGEAARSATRMDFETATIPELQRAMDAGRLSSVALTRFYLNRIRRIDGRLHSVLSTSPDALAQARASDERRRAHRLRGPMDGIPVLLKDNIDIRGRPTTAGSLAMVGSRPRDAFLTGRLRQGGAVLLGKANLSEWAFWRSTQGSNGWSAIGGQVNNPYVLDRNPCGSSAGSGAAAAANLATVAIGTETDGSIICPSNAMGLVGLKPTLGRVSRTGIVPVSAAQDTAGPMTRNVTDTAIVLAAIQGADPADPPTREATNPAGYLRFLNPNALRGARIGVWRAKIGLNGESDAIFRRALARLRELGAIVVDPADLPGIDDLATPEFAALTCEFKHDVNRYLARTPGRHPRDLAELIAFNKANAARELPFFGQELLEQSQATSGDPNDPACARPRRTATSLARRALDETLTRHRLDAIVAPSGAPAWRTDFVYGDHEALITYTPAAVAGYPDITVPAGQAFGLPVGLSFMGARWAEPKLLALAYAFEQATHARKPPRFLRSTPPTDGVHPWPPTR